MIEAGIKAKPIEKIKAATIPSADIYIFLKLGKFEFKINLYFQC
jgi:hypothetical protein